MSTLKELVNCPYNRNHTLRRCKVQNHITNCRERYQNVFILTCRFNCQKLCEEDPQFLGQAAPEDHSRDSVGSKSKRRRVKIKERLARKGRKPRNESSRKSDLKDKAEEMENQEEMKSPWVETIKKKSSKKNSSRASNVKAQPSVEDAIQPSKSSMKRSQKKLRKERATVKTSSEAGKTSSEAGKTNGEAGKIIPLDRSVQKKEYVIKFNESVTVTETNLARKEVYIHYPTKKVLPAETALRSGLGIQPMMLQKICFEAFVKMQNSSEGEGSGILPLAFANGIKAIQGPSETMSRETPSVDEDENKTIQDSSETANGVTPSVDEDENKTLQDSNETLNEGAQSVIKKGKKPIWTSDGKRNAAVQNSKRSKAKKNKKKSNLNQSVTVPYNVGKTSFATLEHRDCYAKFMIPDPDAWPPSPPTRPDPQSFPPPYLEIEDQEFSEDSEDFEYEDHEAYEDFHDDEVPNGNKVKLLPGFDHVFVKNEPKDEEKTEQKMKKDEEKTEQKMKKDEEKTEQKMKKDEEKTEQKVKKDEEKTEQKVKKDEEKTEQKMKKDEEKTEQKMKKDEEKTEQKVKKDEEKTEQKMKKDEEADKSENSPKDENNGAGNSNSSEEKTDVKTE